MSVYIPKRIPADALRITNDEAVEYTNVESYIESLPISQLPLSWKAPASEAYNDYEWVLNEFDTADLDALELIPVRRDEPWETVDMLANLHTPQLILGILPAITQSYQRLHAALERVGLPTFNVAPDQSGVVPALLREMPIGGIITMQTELPRLLDAVQPLAESKKMYCQVILGPRETPINIARGENIFSEVHIVPGVVGLFQCECLSKRKTPIFHVSDRFIWEFRDSTVLVTDTEKHRRFARLAFPHTFRVEETVCPCGRDRELSFL
jgi:hypothetical protein